VHVYNWSELAWAPLSDDASASPDDFVQQDAIWVAVSGEAPAVDYLSVTLTGDVEAWRPPVSEGAIIWPPEGLFDWSQDGDLMPNGALTQADGGIPAGWTKQGQDAIYLPEGVVTEGTGEFGGERGDHFTCAGAEFSQTVRPLDMLVVDAELEGGPNFLVQQITDDETLDLRRWPDTELGVVPFEVRRWSGLRAVPGGCCIEVKEGSMWETSVSLEKGQYRLAFFYRCFNPGAMNAQDVASGRVDIELQAGDSATFGEIGSDLDTSYVWLRGFQDIDISEDGDLHIAVGAQGPEAVQYTGFSLERR
jgi:hypothetical protein